MNAVINKELYYEAQRGFIAIFLNPQVKLEAIKKSIALHSIRIAWSWNHCYFSNDLNPASSQLMAAGPASLQWRWYGKHLGFLSRATPNSNYKKHEPPQTQRATH